jgi:hypothetical protein
VCLSVEIIRISSLLLLLLLLLLLFISLKRYYIEPRRRGISCIQLKEGRLTGLVTYWVGTAFCNTILKERQREGGTEVKGRRRRRRKQLLDDPKEKREYWKLIEEVLDVSVCRTGFGRGCGSVVRQTAE